MNQVQTNQIQMKKRQMQMVSWILGLIVLVILGNILKDNGIAYFAIAIEVFLLFWTVTGGALAEVLGRILRGRSNKGQFKNMKKLRRTAFVIEGFWGLTGSVLMFLLAKPLGQGLFGGTYSVAMIKILAPVIFIRTLSSVLLGCFQGEGTELPAVISYFARQIGILGFGLLFANLFQNYGNKVSDLLRQENFTAMYGGMGVALAVFVTELLLAVFLFFVYRGSRRRDRRSNGEGMRTTDTFSGQMALLFSNLFPGMLKLILLLLPLWLGALFYSRTLADAAGLADYGVLYGKVLPILGVVILPGCLLLMESAHKVVDCIYREEQRYARGHFQGGVHMVMVYGMFSAIFVALHAPHLAGIFCETSVELTAQMLRFGAFLILLFILGFYLTELLTVMGGRYYILGLMALYNLIYAGSLALFLNGGKAGVRALVYSAVAAGVVYVAGLVGVLFMKLRYPIDWLQAVAVPAGAACVTGLILLLLSKVLHPHLGDGITLMVALVLGNLCYWALLMLMRNFREQELPYIPCGRIVKAIGQMLRIY